jgi:hypothetical protein
MHWRQLENGRVTHSLEWAIVALALLVIPVILIEESHPSDVRAHWLDAAIVVLIAPFLPALLNALRASRAIRLLRLLRLAALASRALAAQRLLTSRQGFRYIALATVLLVLVTGVAMSVADREEFADRHVVGDHDVGEVLAALGRIEERLDRMEARLDEH